jgi:CSLREA domain-containing protein
MTHDLLRRSARPILAASCGLCLVVFWLLVLSHTGPARAAGFNVTQLADDNGACDANCSLREAILAANATPGADTILLPAGVHRLTITGTCENAGMTGDLDVTDALTITGAGVDQSMIDAAGLSDRVLHVLAGSVVISGVTIRNGSRSRECLWPENDGGGILNEGTLTVINSAVISNSAYSGGGMRSIGTLKISGSMIVGNSASVAGGGLMLSGTSAIINSDITSNTAEVVGGGLFSYQGQTQVSSNTISYNTAYEGGGLATDFDVSLISANRFVGNTVSGVGGGVWLHYHGPATLSGNTFIANAARAGGAVCISECDSATLRGNTILSNTASYAGGGLAAEVSNLNSEGDLLIDNVADEGGGMFLVVSTATLTNSVVVANQARVSGSGLEFDRSSVRLLHATVHHNTGADGSGVRLDSASSVLITNTIIADQVMGITATAGSAITATGVLWFDNQANTGGTGYIQVTHAYTGDPAFAPDGYHIGSGSAAINRGVASGVGSDIDGEARGSLPDLGADEYPLVEGVYLPLVVRD